MEFKVTFEDGSSAYLEHFGVKGMHWGVRNAETQAKYAGGKGGQRRYRLASHGSKYGQSVTNQRRAYNAKQSKAKQIAKVGLLGVSGSRAYNTSRSRGLSRADSLNNAVLGEAYIAGVKHKQKKAGTTKTKISNSAKLRAQYANSQSTKKQVAKIALGGSIMTAGYDTARSRGAGRLGSAAVTAVLGGGGTAALARYSDSSNAKKHGKNYKPQKTAKNISSKKSSSSKKSNSSWKNMSSEQKKSTAKQIAKDSLKAGLVGAVAGPYAANAYTMSNQQKRRKQ